MAATGEPPVLPLTQAISAGTLPGTFPVDVPVDAPWNMLEAFATPRTRVPLDQVKLTNPLHEPYPHWHEISELETRVETQSDSQEMLRRDFGNIGSPECPRFPYIPAVTQAIERGNLSQLRTTIKAVHTNPWKVENMQRLACLLQSLSHRSLLGPEDSDMKPLANGGDAVVARGLLAPRFAGAVDPNDPPPFIIKTAINEDTETFNEMLVGLYGLNALRATVPNFMYIYGAYKCAPAEIETDPNDPNKVIGTRLCPKTTPSLKSTSDQDLRYYEMVETVSDASTLYRFIVDTINTDWDPIVYADTIDAILGQTMLALAVAQEACDFAHQDLHDANVLICDLGREVSIRYPFKDGSVYWVRTRFLCTLIDYGRSFCRIEMPAISQADADTFDPAVLSLDPINKKTIIHASHIDPGRGLSFTSAQHLYDVCRICGSVAAAIEYSSLARHAFRWLEPLFATTYDYQTIRAYRHKWQACFNSAPLNITINKRDVVDARLGDVGVVLVKTNDLPSGWPAPLM